MHNNNNTTETHTAIATLVSESAADAILNIAPAATFVPGQKVFGQPSMDIRVQGVKVAWMQASAIHLVTLGEYSEYIAALLGEQVKKVDTDSTGFPTIRLHTRTVGKSVAGKAPVDGPACDTCWMTSCDCGKDD